MAFPGRMQEEEKQERGKERERKRQRDKERKLERQKGRVLRLHSHFFFFSLKERREFLIWAWGLPALRAKESGVFKTWVLGTEPLFVGPQEAGNFGAEQLDEGFWQHLLVLLCVFEVVLGVSQHFKEGLDEFLVLQRMAGASVSVSRGERVLASTPQQPLLLSNRPAQRRAAPPSPLPVPPLEATAQSVQPSLPCSVPEAMLHSSFVPTTTARPVDPPFKVCPESAHFALSPQLAPYLSRHRLSLGTTARAS